MDSFIDIFYFWPFSWLLLQLFHLTLIAWAFLLYYHNPFTSLRIISKSVKEVFSNKGYYYDPNQFVKLIMCAHVTNVRIEYCISFLKILFCIHQGIVLTFAEVSYYQQKRHKKFWLRDNYLAKNLRYYILRKSENVLKFDIIYCGNKIH